MSVSNLSGWLVLSGALAIGASAWVLGGRRFAGWRKSVALAKAKTDNPTDEVKEAEGRRAAIQAYSSRLTAIEAVAIVLVALSVLVQIYDVWKEKTAMASNPPVPTSEEVAKLIATSEAASRAQWTRDIEAATTTIRNTLNTLDGEVKDLQRRVKALEDRQGSGGGKGKGGGGPDPRDPLRPDSGGGGARAAMPLTLENLERRLSSLTIRITTIEEEMHVPIPTEVPIETPV